MLRLKIKQCQMYLSIRLKTKQCQFLSVKTENKAMQNLSRLVYNWKQNYQILLSWRLNTNEIFSFQDLRLNNFEILKIKSQTETWNKEFSHRNNWFFLKCFGGIRLVPMICKVRVKGFIYVLKYLLLCSCSRTIKESGECYLWSQLDQ